MSENKYDNTNRGVLFKNDRKTSEKHSDYQGTVNVDGKDFYINAWVKDGKKGKFFSLSVKPKATTQQPRHTGEDDDRLPF